MILISIYICCCHAQNKLNEIQILILKTELEWINHQYKDKNFKLMYACLYLNRIADKTMETLIYKEIIRNWKIGIKKSKLI